MRKREFVQKYVQVNGKPVNWTEKELEFLDFMKRLEKSGKEVIFSFRRRRRV